MLIGVTLSGLPRIRRSVRAFARAPALALALLLTIALGVGSNAAVYGFLQGLRRTSSTVAIDRIVSIFGQDRNREAGPLSADEYVRLKSIRGIFEWIGAARVEPRYTKIDGHSEIATVAAVTPELAGSLAIPLGDGLVISQRIWKNEFGGKSVAGLALRIGDEDLRINGVAPAMLDGLYSDQSVDIWARATGKDFEPGGAKRRHLCNSFGRWGSR
jgi:MacB-like periplasmic core domain